MTRTQVRGPAPSATDAGPVLRRAGGCGGTCDCERKRLQRFPDASARDRRRAPPIVHEVLGSPGRLLDPDLRTRMESQFGHDFSRVRIHDDAHAAESAAAVGARAYTVGYDIVFGHDRYAPRDASGSRLLAHELAHVTQQRDARDGWRPSLEVGDADDVLERDADARAARALSDSPPSLAPSVPARLQRSALDTFLDVLLFVPRLFGAGGYTDNALKEYLTGLKTRRAIENGIFSDNKARGCVDADDERRLTALGAPYDLEVKRLLVEEMVTRHTSFLDERAAIKLLRRQTDADLQQIVTQLGRDRIWGKFSGANRRIIEAVTMTAADAGDALVRRLRGLDPDDVQDYELNARDPAVKQAAHRAWVMAKTTVPVPDEATVTPEEKLTFKIGDLEVIADQDAAESKAAKGQGITRCDVARSVEPRAEIVDEKVVGCEPPKLVLRVGTSYGPGTNTTGSTDYGRGTTEADKAAGTTSLRFHESRHGQDCFDFVRTHAIPTYPCPVGADSAAFQRSGVAWHDALKKYNDEAFEYSTRNTDCVGKSPPTAEAARGGLKVAVCPPKKD